MPKIYGTLKINRFLSTKIEFLFQNAITFVNFSVTETWKTTSLRQGQLNANLLRRTNHAYDPPLEQFPSKQSALGRFSTSSSSPARSPTNR
jgi:hypothetical protein